MRQRTNCNERCIDKYLVLDQSFLPSDYEASSKSKLNSVYKPRFIFFRPLINFFASSHDVQYIDAIHIFDSELYNG